MAAEVEMSAFVIVPSVISLDSIVCPRSETFDDKAPSATVEFAPMVRVSLMFASPMVSLFVKMLVASDIELSRLASVRVETRFLFASVATRREAVKSETVRSEAVVVERVEVAETLRVDESVVAPLRPMFR